MTGLFGSFQLGLADTKGEIGYHVVGRLPKATKDQFGLQELKPNEFQFEYLSPEDHPHVVRPKRGYVVTANQKHYGPDSLYKGGNGYAFTFRGFLIEKKLKEKINKNKKVSVDDFKEIQCDVEVPEYEFFKPFFEQALAKSNHELKDLYVLSFTTWNGKANLQCSACPVFRETLENLKEKHQLNDVSLYQFLKSGKDGEMKTILEKALTKLFNKKENRFFNWGEYHQLYFDHLSGRNDLGEKQDPMGTIGDQNTINPGTAKFEDGQWKHYSGASKRLIVEMTQTPKVWFSLPAPNRTNFYLKQKDNWDNWAQCEYKLLEFPIDWSKVDTKKL